MGFNLNEKTQQLNVYDRPRWFQVSDELEQPMWHGGTPTEDDPEALQTRKPVRILIYSTLSSRYRRAHEKGRGRMLKTKGKKRTDGAESLKREAEEVAECMGGWEGFTQGPKDAEIPLPFTTATAAKLLNKFWFVQAQCEGEMDDAEAFSSAASAD